MQNITFDDQCSESCEETAAATEVIDGDTARRIICALISGCFGSFEESVENSDHE